MINRLLDQCWCPCLYNTKLLPCLHGIGQHGCVTLGSPLGGACHCFHQSWSSGDLLESCPVWCVSLVIYMRHIVGCVSMCSILVVEYSSGVCLGEERLHELNNGLL